jgi:hypothetical protein
VSATAELLEKEKVSQDWTSNAGLYANLSRWPNEVEYYIKCPKCGQVHGKYKTMRDAHDHRLCDACNVKAVDAIKKEVRQVIADPQKKVRTLASIVREDDNLPVDQPPAPEPPPDQDAEIFFGQEPMAEINRMLFSNWALVAIRDLAHHLGVGVDDISVDTGQYAPGDYNENDSESSTFFRVDAPGETWLIFKDDSVAVEYAEKIVKIDMETQPEMFGQEFLAGYIDDDRLAQAIGDPYEDYGDEERNLDYEEQLELMVEKDEIEADDPVFFKKNGEPRVRTQDRANQLGTILDAWIEKTKPTLDPWEWLRDVYGKDEAVKEALKMVSFDATEAAEAAVSSDGWPHYVARHDEHSVDLENGAVAARLD